MLLVYLLLIFEARINPVLDVVGHFVVIVVEIIFGGFSDFDDEIVGAHHPTVFFEAVRGRQHPIRVDQNAAAKLVVVTHFRNVDHGGLPSGEQYVTTEIWTNSNTGPFCH